MLGPATPLVVQTGRAGEVRGGRVTRVGGCGQSNACAGSHTREAGGHLVERREQLILELQQHRVGGPAVLDVVSRRVDLALRINDEDARCWDARLAISRHIGAAVAKTGVERVVRVGPERSDVLSARKAGCAWAGRREGVVRGWAAGASSGSQGPGESSPSPIVTLVGWPSLGVTGRVTRPSSGVAVRRRGRRGVVAVLPANRRS